ncbi:hypothetical protein SHI21_11605 [Bacteriovorax sp. PP10]|uniref:Uncharacterized protein n=1 Tax=Bacteriovorax antarcticus TaxID=3088717 RepID=A0ABU5VWY4_9BACT|nr:hypothetical protein [Bacteriovorax sp. PP10]MEA9356858.1 hypothetical protein [Bacteriovorax sp. PP10]
MFAPTPVPSKPLTFSEKKNCSSQSYAYITKRDEAREKKVTLYEHNKLQERTVDWYLTKEADLQSCYTEFIKAGRTEEYHVCLAIGVSSKSKIDFAEASDEVNKLDAGLKSCLEKKLKSYDAKSLKAKFGNKFIMPLRLPAKKV